jgi:asparagine synthase (glutamine-hydrolysing)
MCGLAGLLALHNSKADIALASHMADALVHRGPDESGSYISPDGRCAMAVRRLAIIDPPLSHQPMVLGDLSIAFNGEIYNYRALRDDLLSRGVQLRTQGDTEVLLHLYRLHGAPGMLERISGMWALAIYDGGRGTLLLARDRLGQKPLWYADTGGALLFASEAKALLAAGDVDRSIRPQAVVEYVSFGYVPGPRSIWRGLHKLAPGHYMYVQDRPAPAVPYWQPGPGAPPPRGIGAADVRQAVSAAVEAQLVSDVGAGILLSGGIDSAAVAAAASTITGGNLRTYSAGFAESSYDERPLAAAVARHLGTAHGELEIDCGPDQCIGEAAGIFDEPLADSSSLALRLICRAARQAGGSKVLLTGDGGDEVFGGYDRYRAVWLSQTMGPLEFMLTYLAARVLAVLPARQERSLSARLRRFAKSLNQPAAMAYLGYRSIFGPGDLGRLLSADFAASVDLEAPAQWFCGLYEGAELDDEALYAQRHDLLTYLPDDLLVKSDMASMRESVELRAPLLDHKLVELGLGLPLEMRLTRRRGKVVLREAFADALPAATLRGRKKGFGIPLAKWLRGSLRGHVRELVLGDVLRQSGFFRREALAGLVNDHLAGRDDHSHRLWALMMLALWLPGQG